MSSPRGESEYTAMTAMYAMVKSGRRMSPKAIAKFCYDVAAEMENQRAQREKVRLAAADRARKIAEKKAAKAPPKS